MNETEKKEIFSLTGTDYSNVHTMDHTSFTPQPVMNLSDRIRSYRLTQMDLESTRLLRETPKATVSERIGAGVEESIENILDVPEEVKNIGTRLFANYIYPNATKEQALAAADASSREIAYYRKARTKLRAMEGVSPDDWIKNLSSGVTTVGAYSLLSFATGGTGLYLTGFQEAGEAGQEWFEEYSKKNTGEIYNRPQDALSAIGHGIVAGKIEKGLGVERLFSPLIARNVFSKVSKGGKLEKALKVGAVSAGGEALEESLQDVSKYAFGHMTGADTRSKDELLQEIANDAIYAAVIGGGFGAGAYHINRSRMINELSDMGMSQVDATEAADEILDKGTNYILNDFVVRDQIQKNYGNEFNLLVDKIKSAITATGREDLTGEDLDKYAQLNAVNLVAPAINIANLQQLPVSEVLSLANIVVERNAVHLEMPNVNNAEKLQKTIEQKKEELTYLNSLVAVDNKKRKAQLREQIKLLTNRIETLTGNEKIRNARTTARKAQRDQRVIAKIKPEIIADLQGIRNAQNEKFVYVGETKLPVNYEVRSIDEIQPSHIKGEPNPNYTLKELQNRTRGTVVDEAILQNRAANLRPEELAESPNTQYGAPLVNLKNEVISGNGRLETIRKAYDLGNTSYKEMLDKLGYNTEGIERPVLVRKTVDDLTPAQQVAVAEASNVSETSAFDHARQAMNDAKLLKKGVSDPVTFADELPLSERQAYIRENGQYDLLALQRRFDDAVMAYILGDTKTFDAVVLSNKLPQKVMGGLSQNGASIVEFDKNFPEQGLKKDLRNALLKLSQMNSRAEYISAIQQRDIEDGMTFSSDALLYGMAFTNNSSQMGNFLNYYIERHANYLNSEKDSFLADTLPKFTKEDITSQIIRNSVLTAEKFNNEGITEDANLKTLFLNKIPAQDEAYNTTIPSSSQLFEQANLAIENARLDEVYPEYKGETININGKERTVYNSNGDRIAKSKEALENFYKWFGDSKVVDEQGRPLVVYHGTNELFDTFDTKKIGYNGTADGAGFNFTTSRDYAESFTFLQNGVMPLYLKIENPVKANEKVSISEEQLDKIINRISNEFLKEKESIKSWEETAKILRNARKNTKNASFFDMFLSDVSAYGNEYNEDANVYSDFRRIVKEETGIDGYENDYKGHKVYVAFEPNQIKSTSNRGTYSESENIYYQEGEDRDLVALHSISSRNLDRAIDFGGFPVPSIAIVKRGQEFGSQFGAITLVGNKDMIDPSRSRNEVYNRDIWSKTFPFATYGKVKKKTRDDFRDTVKEYFVKSDSEDELGSLLYYVDRGVSPEKAVTEFEDSDGARLMYLEKEKGKKIDIPTYDTAQRLIENINSQYGIEVNKEFVEKIAEFESYPSKEVMEKDVLPLINEAIDNSKYEGKEKYANRLREVARSLFIKDGKVDEFNIEGLIRRCKEYVREKGTKKIDKYALRDKFDELITDYDDYSKWAKKYIEDNLVGEPMVEVGKRLLPFNLENVTKAMTYGVTKNAQESLVYGTGKVIAAGAKQLKSIKEIKLEGKKLVSKEEQEKVIEKLQEDMHAFTDIFSTSSGFDSSIYQKEAAFVALGKVTAKENPTREDMQNALNYEFGNNKKYSDEVLDAGVKIAKNTRNLARYYFEAKPQRAVRLNEFSGAIIPTDTKYDAIAERVEKEGLKVLRSDNQVEALNQFEDVYFQRGKANINGYFDAELKTVVIGSNFNYGTLPHEFAHFWLDKMFTMWKSGDTTAEFNEMFQGLADILGITKEQTSLTTNQHEQYATMTEGYLFNRAAFPDGAKPAMNLFFDWCPEQYQSLLDIGYRDEKGEIHNPIFSREALKWFDDFYANMVGLNNSSLSLLFDNPRDQNGEKIEADSTQMEERGKILDEVSEEPEDVMRNQPQAVKQAYADEQNRENPLVKDAYDEAISREEKREKTLPEKIKQYVKIGRGTNTRAGMDEAAQEYIKNNPERANEIAFGSPIAGGVEGFEDYSTGSEYVENNSGVDRAVLIINVMKDYPENSPEYAALYHNLALTRSYAGKTGGLTNDISQQFYLKGYATVNKALESKVALKRYGKGNNSVDLWNRDIDKFIKDNIDAIFSTEPESVERDKALNKFFDNAAAVLGADNPTQFMQENLNRARKMTKKDRKQFIEFARREIKKKAGAEMSSEEVSQLMTLSIEAQKAAIDIDSNDINKATSASLAIRKWQNFVNTKGVQKSILDRIIGEWMPRAMLSGISTHVVNNVSNFVNDTFVKAATVFHFGNNVVSRSAISKEQERLWAIYNATGQNLAESLRVDQVSKLHAENYQLPEATNFLQKIDPFRLLGKEDFYFRSKRYLDTLARIASKDAKGDKKEATRLFNEYKKMNSTEPRAAEARMQAITVGNLSVFTCDGNLAKIVSNVRRELDKINLVALGETGHYGLGTMIAPFAKVPTNIIGMGLEALASPFKSLGYLTGIKKNWDIRDTIALENFAGSLAIVLAYIAAACDYEPPYEKGQKYDPNKPYDSIKIGGIWVNLDLFGAFSTPLRYALTMVHGYKQGYTHETNIAKGLETILGEIPFMETNYEWMINKPFQWLESESYNQLNKAVPALIKPVIQQANRDAGTKLDWWNPEFMPRWRAKFERQYGFDSQPTAINEFIKTLVFGRRINIDTK